MDERRHETRLAIDAIPVAAAHHWRCDERRRLDGAGFA
jgi:hypothetical protein